MTDQEKEDWITMINTRVDTGIELICIDNISVENMLTKGKKYKVRSLPQNPSISVIADDGVCYAFNRTRFQSLQDMREEKLDQLGI